ncbi:unnamed protein product [Pieris brassicae]|uniref:Galectin n=1 Tax=Pieris brassicae TaxID=7116 RepID=A0A9P0XEL3_PIEBR|nr:unnamed protein product [Pieris brassicae]
MIISNGMSRSVHSAPNNSEPSTSYNLPTELSSGTIITIQGKLKIDSTLRIMLLTKFDYACGMTFLPQKEVVIQDSTEFPYNVRPADESITYTIYMDARSVDQTIDVIEMYFESDNAGLLTLNRCPVDSLSSIEKILINGKQNVVNMTFNFQKSSLKSNEAHDGINGRTVNGYPLGSTSHRENEMAFRLPRPLENGDIIKVEGIIKSDDRQKFCMALTTGDNYIDKHNIACEVEADFLNNQFVIRTVVNGQIYDKILDSSRGDPSPTDMFPDSVPEFILEFNVNAEYNQIDLSVGMSFLCSVDLKHNLRSISHILLSDDILNVKELCIKFNQNQ